MHTHLKPREYYEDIYDRITVDWGRRDTEMFTKMHDEFFKIMPKEPRTSFRSVFHLNLIYVLFVGNNLLDRYDKREEYIRETMNKDGAKDEQVTSARLTKEPKCQHCDLAGLRITDKMLHHRKSFDEPEEVLFMLKCTNCDKNSAVWGDGTPLEHRKNHCPKCKSDMDEKDIRKGKVLTTIYTCSYCGHTYKDVLDLRPKKETKSDPDFESDRALFCLQDEKVRQELRDAKRRYDEMARLGREFKEKEDNKHIYDAMAELKKPKITELAPLLSPALEKAGYTEFGLDRPGIGKDVIIGFNCLDSKSDRDDYHSKKNLRDLVKKVLEDTNWRLMSDGISYRLGYLNGRLKAYEREDDIKELVIRANKLKPKVRRTRPSKNAYTIKGRDGKDIIL